jgi:hypothetical protein
MADVNSVVAATTNETNTVVAMGSDRIMIGEALLRPGSVASDAGLAKAPGIVDAVIDAIAEACRHVPAWGPLLWQSVVMAGGVAAIPGLQARVQAELRQAAPEATSVMVWDFGAMGGNAAWFGASLMADRLPKLSRSAWESAAQAPGMRSKAAAAAGSELVAAHVVL